MSAETQEWLSKNILVGMTDKRGNAWHWKEGTESESNHYPGPIPISDVMRKLFSWTPHVASAYADLGNFEAIPDPEHRYIYRPDTREILGLVGSDYKIHPYDEWLLEGPAAILGSTPDDLVISGAGLLKKGAIAYVEISRPETSVVEGFEFRSNLLAYTALNGMLMSRYDTSNNVSVCDNTVHITQMDAERAGTSYKVKHSSGSRLDIARAREILHVLVDVESEFAKGIRELLEWEVTDGNWERFLDALVITKDTKRSLGMGRVKRDKLNDLYYHDIRVAPWHGTALGVLQATNTYNTHYQTVRGSGLVERNQMDVIMGTQRKADTHTLTILDVVVPRPTSTTV